MRFDPAQCERRFTVVASDYVAAVLLPAVSRELARVAPGVRLSVRDLPLPRDGDVVSEALDYRRSDCVVVPQRRLSTAYPQQALLTDELCCLVSADQPAYANGIGLTAYCEAEHVVREFADGRHLALTRRIWKNLALFAALPWRWKALPLCPILSLEPPV